MRDATYDLVMTLNWPWNWKTGTLRSVVGVLVVIGALVWVFDAFVKHQAIAKNFAVVVPGSLYRSGELVPSTTKDVVERYNIRTIIDLGAHEPGTAEELLAQRTAEALGVDRVVFGLEGDGRGDPNDYLDALRIIADPERAPVLVHCAAGSERTGACIAFYRHIYEGVDLDAAYEETKSHRHRTHRNPLLEGVIDTWAEPLKRALDEGLESVPQPQPEPQPEPEPKPEAGDQVGGV